MYLLITTLLHNFIAGFVWQSVCFPFTCWSLYFVFILWQFGLGRFFIPIYLLGLLGAFLGAVLGNCSTKILFIRRCDWTNKTNILFYVKLFILFVIYNIFEFCGPSLWSIPILFVAVLIVCVLFWWIVKDCKVLKQKHTENACFSLCGNVTYKEVVFCRYAFNPALWLVIAVILIGIVNMGWYLVLFNVPYITPLRIQCVAVLVLFLVVLACLILFNCGKKQCHRKRKKCLPIHRTTQLSDPCEVECETGTGHY